MTAKSEPPAISPLAARHRIHNAIIQMGLSFADCVHLIVYDTKVETACWSYNLSTGEESVRIGTQIASLSEDDIEMVIRHEFLHRSTYHGFHERFHDPDLCNIVQDICINRLLFEAYEEKMRHLSACVYPDETKTTVIALADCSAEPDILDRTLGDLWHHVWDRGEDGSFHPINPTSLYFRLVEIRASLPGLFTMVFTFGGEISSKAPVILVEGPLKDAISAAIDEINRKLPAGSTLGRDISSFSVVPQMIGFSSIERFLKEIRYTMEARAMNAALEAKPSWVRQAFPMFPSRRGILYKLLDLEKELGYYNQQTEWHSEKLKLGFYVDVSGSMEEHYPVLVSFIRVFKAWPLKVYGFTETVREMNVADFIEGRIEGRGGTDFNAPILSFIGDPELIGGILFTDGQGDAEASTEESLRLSKKALFVVYFHRFGSEMPASRLDRMAERTSVFET